MQVACTYGEGKLLHNHFPVMACHHRRLDWNLCIQQGGLCPKVDRNCYKGCSLSNASMLIAHSVAMYKNWKVFIEKRISFGLIWYGSHHARWSIVRIIDKKAKCKPECRYKQKAIIDIGRNWVLGFVLLVHHPLYIPDLTPSDFHHFVI